MLLPLGEIHFLLNRPLPPVCSDADTQVSPSRFKDSAWSLTHVLVEFTVSKWMYSIGFIMPPILEITSV